MEKLLTQLETTQPLSAALREAILANLKREEFPRKYQRLSSGHRSLLVYTVLSLSAEAGRVYTLCTALGGFFYHPNIKTPPWISYISQRPEMH